MLHIDVSMIFFCFIFETQSTHETQVSQNNYKADFAHTGVTT